MKSYKYDVFISHKSCDDELTEQLYDYFVDQGLRPWLDTKNIQPPMTYGAAIAEGIAQSAVMVFIYTAETNNSRDILNEIDQAHRKHMPIIVFYVEECRMSGEMSYYLSRTQWLKALGDSKKYFKSLVDAVRRILKGENNLNENKTIQYESKKYVAVVKLYANQNCVVYNGKLRLGEIKAYDEEPLYWYVDRRGEYRLRAVTSGGKTKVLDVKAEPNEERIVDFRFVHRLKQYAFFSVFACLCIIFLYFVYYIVTIPQDNMFDIHLGRSRINTVLMDNSSNEELNYSDIKTNGVKYLNEND